MKILIVLIAVCVELAMSRKICRDKDCGVCFDLYEPVCGENKYGNRQTFSNGCFLNLTNCEAGKKTLWSKISDEACPEDCGFCSELYDPICAENTCGVRKTFSNECFYKMANCESGETRPIWKKVSKGECSPKECNPCTKEYNPVCGVDDNGVSQTFGNLCMLKYANCQSETGPIWTFNVSGACPDHDCGACFELYLPVCGANKYGNRQTFSNGCFLNMANCEAGNQTVWSQISDEACVEDCGFCSELYDPVCAVNTCGVSKTFSNECFYKMANCESGELRPIWKLEARNECQ